MGVYNNNKDGTRSTLANTIQVVDAPMEQFVSRGEFNAIVPSDTSADNKLVNDDTVNDIWKVQGELGAKNLLYYPYDDVSITRDGITWTINDDGSITVNGTSTEYTVLYLRRDFYPITPKFVPLSNHYIMSLKNGSWNTVAMMIQLITNGEVIWGQGIVDEESKITFTDAEIESIKNGASIVGIRLFVNANTTIDNVTVYPMLRISSDADGTWYPYAMTNKELTDNINSVYTKLKDDIEKLFHPKLMTHTIVTKPLQFNNANLVVFGDSIAKGMTSNPNDSSLALIDNPWVKQFADKANANLNNQAISATTLAVRDGHIDSIYEKINAFSDSADIIIVAGGTNDYGFSVPIGNYSDISPTTVYGALNSICDTLKTNYPNIPVIFITPINRPSIVNLEDEERFNSIRNAIYEKATVNGYLVIDGRDLGFPYKQGVYQQEIISDKLHPSVQGHKMYADAVSSILL